MGPIHPGQGVGSGDANHEGDDQAVVVHLRIGGGRYGAASNQDVIFTLENQIAAEIIRHRAGEFDGDEVEGGWIRIYTYGPSADLLAELILPILRRSRPREGSFLIKRYGPPGAREDRVALPGY